MFYALYCLALNHLQTSACSSWTFSGYLLPFRCFPEKNKKHRHILGYSRGPSMPVHANDLSLRKNLILDHLNRYYCGSDAKCLSAVMNNTFTSSYLQAWRHAPADTRCVYNRSLDHTVSVCSYIDVVVLESCQTIMPHSKHVFTPSPTTSLTPGTLKQEPTCKQIIRYDESTQACLGVRMHDWHTVGGAFPLHLIPLIISVSVEQMSMPSKTLSSTSILSVKHHAAHYHYTTLQLTDFTSAIECATVETLASNSSRVV